MHSQFAIIKNVIHLQAALDTLMTRDAHVPGMGLIHGSTGFGKTATVTWMINRIGARYVRASATWTPSAMLTTIMRELGLEPLRSGNAVMVDQISDRLRAGNHVLFIDEADYLLDNKKMIETVRDLHDVATTPVVLIGMEGIERKLAQRQQLARRIAQWVEFRPADLADARILTEAVCEVSLEDDLIEHLLTEAKGNVGNMTVGLARIEQAAKAGSWKRIDREKWGNRQLFLSRAPSVRG